MRLRIPLVVTLVLALSGSTGTAATAAPAGPVAAASTTAVPAAAPAAAAPAATSVATPAGGHVVVLDDRAVSPAAAATMITTLAERHGVAVEHTYGSALRGFAGRMSDDAARRIAASPGVLSVTPNRTLTAQQAVPWNLDRLDSRAPTLDGRYTPTGTAANVHAYVLDTGIRTSHTDFGGRASFDFNALDANDSDCNGHGTHVAGVLGGATYGVAKGVRLHAVKVLGCDGTGTTASVLAGIDWVARNRVTPAVATLSLGGAPDPALDVAIENSLRAGITYVVAAGNGSGGNGGDACAHSPSRVRPAITVGSIARNSDRAPSSNSGPCVDLFAPGVDVPAPWHTSDTATATRNGTSIAAAHAAGAAALHLAASPAATPADVRRALVANGSRNWVGAPGAGSPNLTLYIGTAPPNHDNQLEPGTTLMSGWSMHTPNAAWSLIMQTDGNLVLYDVLGHPVWHTNTWYGGPQSRLTLQPDGNLVVYSSDGHAMWHTNTWGRSAERFVVQDDGNLVIYGCCGIVRWSRW